MFKDECRKTLPNCLRVFSSRKKIYILFSILDIIITIWS